MEDDWPTVVLIESVTTTAFLWISGFRSSVSHIHAEKQHQTCSSVD